MFLLRLLSPSSDVLNRHSVGGKAVGSWPKWEQADGENLTLGNMDITFNVFDALSEPPANCLQAWAEPHRKFP